MCRFTGEWFQFLIEIKFMADHQLVLIRELKCQGLMM
ncbi:hypothetical protein CF150_24864 [Pseudomonas sp. CF150]|nr:hypothetical protein CF150_24864 [Pseudomonas sp. CF150]